MKVYNKQIHKSVGGRWRYILLVSCQSIQSLQNTDTRGGRWRYKHYESTQRNKICGWTLALHTYSVPSVEFTSTSSVLSVHKFTIPRYRICGWTLALHTSSVLSVSKFTIKRYRNLWVDVGVT